jgi:hypothetical protein
MLILSDNMSPLHAHPDHHLVVPTVVDQRDGERVGGLAVEGCGADAVLDPVGVLDRDPVAARTVSIGDLEAGPALGDLGVDRQVIPLQVEAEDRLQTDPE